MKVSGFSLVRNAILYDYPIVEAITSILPVVDEFVVAVGKSDDETLQLIQSIDSPKLRIVETVWDDSLREGGKVLAVETDKAFDALSEDADWAFYIQGDEVVHENDLPAIKAAMERWKDAPKVEGLLFHYRHFYGSYDYVGDSRGWYRNEVRVLRRTPSIRSYRDAQGFRKQGEKLNVKRVDAYINHYGWVKPPEAQQAKQLTFNKLWHDDDWVQQNVAPGATFDYSDVDALSRFEGTHPHVMLPRIKAMGWEFDHDLSKKNFSVKERLLYWVEKATGWRIGEYKNYRLF